MPKTQTALIELNAEPVTTVYGRSWTVKDRAGDAWLYTPSNRNIDKLRVALLSQVLAFREALQGIAQTDPHMPHTMKGIAKMALAKAKDVEQAVLHYARDYP